MKRPESPEDDRFRSDQFTRSSTDRLHERRCLYKCHRDGRRRFEIRPATGPTHRERTRSDAASNRSRTRSYGEPPMPKLTTRETGTTSLGTRSPGGLLRRDQPAVDLPRRGHRSTDDGA